MNGWQSAKRRRRRPRGLAHDLPLSPLLSVDGAATGSVARGVAVARGGATCPLDPSIFSEMTLHKGGSAMRAIAKHFQIDRNTVRDIVRGKTWRVA